MFTSSAVYTAALGGLLGADAKCQLLADTAGLAGTYKAWLSDSTESPSTRFTKSTTPWETAVTGIKIADNWADLIDGSLDAPPGVDENGVTLIGGPPAFGHAWTGTNTDGTASSVVANETCFDWTFGAGGASAGRGVYTALDVTWTFSGGSTSCTNMRRLYCFQQ